jgi:hypothetical protein
MSKNVTYLDKGRRKYASVTKAQVNKPRKNRKEYA